MSRIYPHIEEYEIGRAGYTFHCTIYVQPSELTEYFKKQIVDHLGDRKVRGEICLGTTKDVVREGLAAGIYDGVIVVKNKSLPASTILRRGVSSIWIIVGKGSHSSGLRMCVAS